MALSDFNPYFSYYRFLCLLQKLYLSNKFIYYEKLINLFTFTNFQYIISATSRFEHRLYLPSLSNSEGVDKRRFCCMKYGCLSSGIQTADKEE